MKRTVSFLLTLLLSLTFIGCGREQVQNSSGAEENERVQAGTGGHGEDAATDLENRRRNLSDGKPGK